MTCIVGIVDKKSKTVIIGGDSASSGGSNIFVRTDPKVFKNGDFIFGCTSSWRMMQLLRFSFKQPEIKTEDIYEYMCTDFIGEVRRCFAAGGYLQKDDDGQERGGFFLVGYKNRLFRVEGDFQVGENLNGTDAVGCGDNFALGALYSLLKTDYSAEEKALKALEAAEFLALGVRRPFTLMRTL